jgi:hypothetical protein
MSPEQAFDKAHTDVEEMLDSIVAVKGPVFADLVKLHINFSTLVTLASAIHEDEDRPELRELMVKVSVHCASEAMGIAAGLAEYEKADVEEILSWGNRLQQQVQQTINQLKESE